jgi:hypothetical protein
MLEEEERTSMNFLTRRNTSIIVKLVQLTLGDGAWIITFY